MDDIKVRVRVCPQLENLILVILFTILTTVDSFSLKQFSQRGLLCVSRPVSELFLGAKYKMPDEGDRQTDRQAVLLSS